MPQSPWESHDKPFRGKVSCHSDNRSGKLLILSNDTLFSIFCRKIILHIFLLLDLSSFSSFTLQDRPFFIYILPVKVSKGLSVIGEEEELGHDMDLKCRRSRE